MWHTAHSVVSKKKYVTKDFKISETNIQTFSKHFSLELARSRDLDEGHEQVTGVKHHLLVILKVF